MKYYETSSHVGPDGTVFIKAPAAFANRQVRVRLAATERAEMTDEEWIRYLDGLNGLIDDPTFVRAPQPDWPERRAFD